MQERNFEKQVRNKMEDLSITPSGPVWQKVEAGIKRKKDKRRILFWLLPLLATGLFTGWWLLHMPVKTLPDKTAISTSPKKATHTIVEPTHTNTTSPKKQPQNSYSTNTYSINKNTSPTIPDKISNKRKTPGHSYTLSPDNIRTANKNHPQPTDEMAFIETNEPIAEPAIAIRPKAVLDMPVATITIPITDSIVQLQSFHPVGVNNTPPILVPNKVAKKWQWSIYGAMGVSGISDDLLDAFALNKVADAPLSYAGAPSYYSSYPIVQIRPSTPSPVSKGLSFSAGIDVKKAIHKKVSIATGLHYAYYSTQTEVGQKISNPAFSNANLLDATTGYRNSTQRYPYTNQYHFIEVPVVVYYSLLKRKPLYIHTGISAAQLLSSNALYYHASSNAYYQSKYYLNKTQLNWQAGISYDFALGKHISLSAGPQIQYGLRTLQKTATAHKPHLFAAGMHMNISVK